jgi:Lhr-like helicase
MTYRIIYRMKVTAIIADELVNDVKAYTRSSTVTEAITIALKDWLDIHNIKELNKKISQNPISINNGQQIRDINRSIC